MLPVVSPVQCNMIPFLPVQSYGNITGDFGSSNEIDCIAQTILSDCRPTHITKTKFAILRGRFA